MASWMRQLFVSKGAAPSFDVQRRLRPDSVEKLFFHPSLNYYELRGSLRFAVVRRSQQDVTAHG
jgi:hypothetical protein